MLSCYIELLNHFLSIGCIWEGFTQSNSKCNIFRHITKAHGYAVRIPMYLKNIKRSHPVFSGNIKKKNIWQPFLINPRKVFENHSKNDNFA